MFLHLARNFVPPTGRTYAWANDALGTDIFLKGELVTSDEPFPKGSALYWASRISCDQGTWEAGVSYKIERHLLENCDSFPPSPGTIVFSRTGNGIDLVVTDFLPIFYVSFMANTAIAQTYRFTLSLGVAVPLVGLRVLHAGDWSPYYPYIGKLLTPEQVAEIAGV